MKNGFLMVVLLIFAFLFSVIITLRLEIVHDFLSIVETREKRVLLSISLKSCQQVLKYHWNDFPISSMEVNINGFNIVCELVDFSSNEATYSYRTFIDNLKLTGYFKIKHVSLNAEKEEVK